MNYTAHFRKPLAILFDLDGTLIDSAPDLSGTVQDMQRARNLPNTTFSDLRPYASGGARSLLGKGFNITPEHPDFENLKTEFLDRYALRLWQDSCLFDGIIELLNTLTDQDIAWGIVTNKLERFTFPLVQAMGVCPTRNAVIAGDTTAYIKPHPEPCLEGARRLGLAPEHCWYVGDDERDIIAGRQAGMYTVAALYGYCGVASPVQAWGADYMAQTPSHLAQHIKHMISLVDLQKNTP